MNNERLDHSHATGKARAAKTLAKSRNVSVNKLIEEMATVMLAEFDAETRFRIRAARGRGRQERGLELLRKAVAKPRSTRSRPAKNTP